MKPVLVLPEIIFAFSLPFDMKLISLSFVLTFATVHGYFNNFPDNALKQISDIIVQWDPSTVKLIRDPPKYCNHDSFANRFLNSILTHEKLLPISIETFSKRELNQSDYKMVTVHILRDNSYQSLNDSTMTVEKRFTRKVLQKFMIIFEEISIKNDHWLEHLFKEFEKNRILDVLIIYYDKNLQIFHYDPFGAGRAIKVDFEVAKLLFHNKLIINNLNGMEFKVQVYDAGYQLQKYVDSNNETKYNGTNIDMCDLLTERLMLTNLY